MRSAPAPRRRAEPTVALINVVFLMLVFFLVAGQIAAPPDRMLELVSADRPSGPAPDDALAIRADGTTHWRGVAASPEDFAAARLADGIWALRILPDRALPAARLLAVAAALRAAGATEVRIVTAKGAP